MDQNPTKLLKSLKDEIAELEAREGRARASLEIARSEAKSQEDRNRRVREALDEEMAQLRQQYIGQHITEKFELSNQNKKLRIVQSNLLDEIEIASTQIVQLQAEAEPLADKKTVLQADVQALESKIVEETDELDGLRGEIRGIKGLKAKLLSETQEIEETHENLRMDLEALSDEVARLETQIIELDADYKGREAELKARETALNSRLTQLKEQVAGLQNEDKRIRQGWAETTMALERREKNIRKRNKLADEKLTRAQQVDDYMKI